MLGKMITIEIRVNFIPLLTDSFSFCFVGWFGVLSFFYYLNVFSSFRT